MAALGIMPIPSRDQFHSNPQHLLYHDYSSVRSTTNPNLQSSHNSNSVQSSTSTSVDESRPSLPSISNLLDIASDNTNTDQARAAPTRSPELHSTSRNSRPDQPQAYRTSWPENHLQSAALDPAGHSRSPSIKNVQYSINNPTQNGMLMSPTYRPEAEQRALAGPSAARYQPNVSPYDAASSTRSYATSPGAMSDGSSYSPIATMNQRPPYAAQMPLGYGPPAHALASQSTPNLPATNPWEHHHYIINSSNSQGGFPPMPDRYICPTCNKAFSRPSSLKIHSHSHTGEKPFKCPHAGCGKAFSVKSNMKRHEKGCHGGGDQADEGADMIEE